MFVRSSTNAEDLPDFNGAGLYDTVPNVRGNDAVLAAIKKVWASVWNFTAYEDRERAGIDHAKVYGGVLVQVGVQRDRRRRAASPRTRPIRPTSSNYTINAKSGLGMRVVDGKKVPESLLVSWYNHGIRVLSRSRRGHDARVRRQRRRARGAEPRQGQARADERDGDPRSPTPRRS